MKRLSLIRHAKSEWANEQLEDIDRPLNARGYADAKTMALRMKAAGNRPDALFSSAAIRASSTALIFARVFELESSQMIFTPKLYEAGEKKFLKELCHLPDQFSNIFVFAHNPTISSVASQLSGEAGLNMPTCGIVNLVADISSWKELRTAELMSFDFPKNEGDNKLIKDG